MRIALIEVFFHTSNQNCVSDSVKRGIRASASMQDTINLPTSAIFPLDAIGLNISIGIDGTVDGNSNS